MITNRELYERILELGEEMRTSQRTLSEYLRALWMRGQPLSDRESLSVAEVADLLTAAARVSPPPLDPAWRTADFAAGDPAGFDRWAATLLSQIADLWDFDERPPGKHARLGVRAPRPRGSGRRLTHNLWYNLDPATYLECAMAGTFGGYDLGDGVRVPVPGPVDPRVPEPPPHLAIGPITWEDLAVFAVCGQDYE